MRGTGRAPLLQPDTAGNVLLWNGEVFGGAISVPPDDLDTDHVAAALCAAPDAVPAVLARLHGPFAFVYWQAQHRRLWFGRDPLGRRSLLLHAGLDGGAATAPLLIASVAAIRTESGFWTEVPVGGVYSVDLSVPDRSRPQPVQHAWPELGAPPAPPAPPSAAVDDADAALAVAERVLTELDRAVRVRCEALCRGAEDVRAPSIGVLFSGGIDSLLLALLAHRHVPAHEPIELINVAFYASATAADATADEVPDRVTAASALCELRQIAPQRDWRLVLVDVRPPELAEAQPRIVDLIAPCCTVMDLSLGAAVWFAARGRGHLPDSDAVYHASARAVLIGTGADEQFAGYARHRSRFAKGGWSALAAELSMELARIAHRNLGRDDRCVADHGREARFPFLDERFVAFVAALPVWRRADLRLPSGQGDKKALRDAARLLGLARGATTPKRALQFGSRITRLLPAAGRGSDALVMQ